MFIDYLAVFRVLIAAAGLGFCWPPSFGLAEVDFQVSYDYYPVQYVKDMSLGDMIVKSSPLNSYGGPHRPVGQASWGIRYPDITVTRPLVDVCLVDNPGIVCTCQISLPRLEGGDAAGRAVFDAYVADVKKHEMEHCLIALSHARRLEERFLKIGKKSCDRIKSALRAEYDNVYSDCRREQKNYDYREYGYKKHLRLETLQSMVDSGAIVALPEDGHYNIPHKYVKKPNLNVLDTDTKKLSQEGIYKDESGVWRNY